jgi:hypothetical protein
MQQPAADLPVWKQRARRFHVEFQLLFVLWSPAAGFEFEDCQRPVTGQNEGIDRAAKYDVPIAVAHAQRKRHLGKDLAGGEKRRDIVAGSELVPQFDRRVGGARWRFRGGSLVGPYQRLDGRDGVEISALPARHLEQAVNEEADERPIVNIGCGRKESGRRSRQPLGD